MGLVPVAHARHTRPESSYLSSGSAEPPSPYKWRPPINLARMPITSHRGVAGSTIDTALGLGGCCSTLSTVPLLWFGGTDVACHRRLSLVAAEDAGGRVAPHHP
jgi:hypothetical protein